VSVLHGYSQTDEPEIIDSCRIATISDLATMKVFAIGGRSEKKDFVDLHEMVMAGLFSIGELMRLFERSSAAASHPNAFGIFAARSPISRWPK
jgi:2-keto-4-pentenoate hydratase